MSVAPIFANSARTGVEISPEISLMRAITAGGNVFSIPKSMPIRFMGAPGVEGSSEFVFPPPGCGGHKERSPGMPEHEELHIPSKRRTVPVMILPVHPEGGSRAVYA